MRPILTRLAMPISITVLAVAVLVAGGQFADARHAAAPGVVTTTPTVVSYQGRILSGGSPFNGTGFFKFAIVNANGSTSYWSNDGSSTAGSEPVAAVPLAITNGLFNVLLGDTTLSGMSVPMGASVFSGADRRLRIWFGASAIIYFQLSPDERIASAPFALNAETLDGMPASAFVSQNQLTITLAAAGYLTQGVGDLRYGGCQRQALTTPQLALLRWYSTNCVDNYGDFAAGSYPQAIAFDGTNIWVPNNSGDNVSVLRVRDGASAMSAPFVGSHPRGIAFDGANMWVANGSSGSVTVLRVSDGGLVRTASTGSGPYNIAFDGTNMWVANFNDNTMSVLRVSDGVNVMTPTVGATPTGSAFDGTNMWVANYGTDTVNVLRASDGFYVMTPTVGAQPFAAAFDGTNVWVTNYGSNSVSVLRAIDGFHVMTVTVGLKPAAIAFDGTNMWVANSDDSDSTLSVLRVADGTLVRTVTAGTRPFGLVFDGAFMWAANNRSNNVSKR